MELDVRHLIPEMILLAAACLCTLLGLSKKDTLRKSTQVLAAAACAIAFAVAVLADQPMYPIYVRFNPNYITILTTVVGFLSVLAAWGMPSKADPSVPDANYRGEFFGMMLFSLAGVAMIGKVNDLIWLFIVLELVSIPTYIMVATGRSQVIAQEAGVKYFFLGALAAAVFLFGFSYLYGAAGSTRYDDLDAWFVANANMLPLALIGLIMVIVGVGYKIAAVPFHFYTPDVYQGAATPVTAFLAYAPKAAGIVAITSMLSLFDFNFGITAPQLTRPHAVLALLTVISVLTMTIGNVLAVTNQRNIKRIFAYSSIAHSGYMLVGLIATNAGDSAGADGVSATFFYLTSYALMNLGAFAVLVHLQGKADAAEDLDDIAGLGKSKPMAALLMTICLLSLIGMPLTLGFWGKFYIVNRAVATGHTYLAIAVMINAAIAAAYYLRIIAAMYLREPLYPAVVRLASPIKIAALVCTAAVLVFFIAPGYLLQANNTLIEEPRTPPAKVKKGAAVTPTTVGEAAMASQ